MNGKTLTPPTPSSSASFRNIYDRPALGGIHRGFVPPAVPRRLPRRPLTSFGLPLIGPVASCDVDAAALQGKTPTIRPMTRLEELAALGLLALLTCGWLMLLARAVACVRTALTGLAD